MRRRLALPLLLLWLTAGDFSQLCWAEPTDDYGDPLPECAVARLGTTRWQSKLGYGTGFSTLAFAPDGNTVAVSCSRGLTLFDAKTGKLAPKFTPDPKLMAAAFSPDGKTLITLDSSAIVGQPGDFTHQQFLIQHWEVGTGKLLRQLEVVGPRASFVNFPIVSADGRFCLATGGGFRKDDGAVIVWDTATGKTVGRVAEMVNHWAPVALSRDGNMLAVVRSMKSVSETDLCLYDVATGKLRHLVQREGYSHLWPEFSPNGAWLVTASHDSVCVWDTATGRLLREIPGIRGPVCFTADGRRMACGDDKGIRLYALPDFTEVRRFEEHGTSVRAMSFSPDGKRLVSGHGDVVAIWDVSTGKQVSFRPGHQSPVCSLALSSDGQTIASGGGRGDGTAYVWDLPTRKARYCLTGHYSSVASVAIAPNGRMLATGDGSLNYQTGGGERHIRLWDLADGRLVRKVPAHLNGVTSLDFAPDGKTLASGGLDARARLWDVASGQRLAQVRGEDGYHWARFAPDGKALLVAESRGRVALWQPDMKERLFELRPPDHTSTNFNFLAPAFTNHGTQVVVPEEIQVQDKEVLRLHSWDVARGKSLRLVEKEQGRSYGHGYAIAPNGRTVATSSRSGAVELWDVETGKRVALMELPNQYGVPLVFSPEGKFLASGSDDTTILIWDIALARRLYLFREMLGQRGDAADKARRLATDPVQAVTYIRQRLEAAAMAENKSAAMLTDLDSDDFATREKASEELEKVAAEVEAPLRLALTRAPSVEVRRRIQQALDGIGKRAESPAGFGVDHVRLAVAILEQLDSADSRAALGALGEGAPDTEVGRAAKAALARQRNQHRSDKRK
jgi:WD40 repeat protein